MKSEDVSKELIKLRKKLLVINTKIKEVLDSCDHDGSIVEKQSYYEGSYYDRACTDTWQECLVCNKITSDIIRETHSWYG